jgi:hypothetical protein
MVSFFWVNEGFNVASFFDFIHKLLLLLSVLFMLATGAAAFSRNLQVLLLVGA